jgi:hypothetical protein
MINTASESNVKIHGALAVPAVARQLAETRRQLAAQLAANAAFTAEAARSPAGILDVSVA